MRKPLVTAALCCLLTAAAAGDVIWMQNGKRYEGKATRKGAKVMIELAYGTIEVRAVDVLRIVKTEVVTPPKPKPVDPITKPEPTKKEFAVGYAVMPESVAFMFMRRIAISPKGLGTMEQRQQVARWRDAAHDRIRKTGSRWLTPKEFKTRRETFDRYLAEAKVIMKQRSRIRALSSRTMTSAQKAELRKIVIAGTAKMRTAATNWPDPAIRSFMLGVANFEGAAYPKAVASFRDACELAPYVSAFHQGHALALVEAAEALPSFIRALELAPDSRQVLSDLREGMKAVKGVQTHSPEFERAKAMSAEYQTPKPKTGTTYGFQFRRIKWELPGKFTQTKDNTLPEPDYDRFSFFQAAGVVVGPHAILVDARVAARAQAVYVRVGDRLVTGRPRRAYSSDWEGKGDPPVSLVIVGDCKFTPPAGAPKFKRGTPVTVHSMNHHTEMGGELMKTTGTVKVPKGGKRALDVALRPGDSAAPVLTADGHLVGFLASRAVVAETEGGPDLLLGREGLAGLIARGAKTKSPSYYWMTKRTVVPKPTEGVVFPVVGVFCEKLNKDADK